MLTLDEIRERGFVTPIRVIHTICGGIVFFHDGVPQGRKAVINPNKVLLANGVKPREGDPIICIHCGYDVRKNQLEFVLDDE
jgi:hypothetical protein